MTVLHAHETPDPALGRVIADLAALDGRAGLEVPVHVALPGVGA